MGRNSFFAQALLGHLNTPGQDIASMLIAVRKDVLAATGGNQVPWENTALTREFAFAPGEDRAAPETLLWQLAATARDPALMRIYLDRYPEGPHVADVRAFLADEEPAPAGDIEVASRDLTPDTGALAESLWDVARRTRLRSLVELYLQHNPDGAHADAARNMLADLPPADDPDAAPELICERLATHDRDATANTAGVTLARLRENAAAAVEACRKAAAAHPEMPHYTALLARATYAEGDLAEAIRLYRDASARGDLRAATSLGLLIEHGSGVPKDLPEAAALYEKAADGRPPRRGHQPRGDAGQGRGRAAGRRPRHPRSSPAPPRTARRSPPTTSASSRSTASPAPRPRRSTTSPPPPASASRSATRRRRSSSTRASAARAIPRRPPTSSCAASPPTTARPGAGSPATGSRSRPTPSAPSRPACSPPASTTAPSTA